MTERKSETAFQLKMKQKAAVMSLMKLAKTLYNARKKTAKT